MVLSGKVWTAETEMSKADKVSSALFFISTELDGSEVPMH